LYRLVRELEKMMKHLTQMLVTRDRGWKTNKRCITNSLGCRTRVTLGLKLML
jgi:hypothetical protein